VFKKEKPHTFDGEMKKSQDVEAWFLGMNMLFRVHGYSKNMKDGISTFSLKIKVDIWWDDVKNVRGIWEEKMTLSEFKKHFRKKYLSERFYDDRERGFYDLNMGCMTNEEYTSRFLELLR